MFVVATAGHVDHGKSTLVRALTGMEPDRWAEERRRGLTIDLGFAWTRLPSGRDVAFVDVPGHERFLANMVAGLGPVPAVCFIVAADEGWQAQSSDHRDVIQALGISHGLVVLTRCDRARHPLDGVLARVRAELADTGLRDAPAVAVSALRGTGLSQLRASLDGVLATLPPPRPKERVRLWIDRSFSISGAGTVVTGTLAAGTLSVGDRLQLVGRGTSQPVTIRGLHGRNQKLESAGPTSRVALNLRGGVPAEQVHRGDALVAPEAWDLVDTVDVRRTMGAPLDAAPTQLQLHLGTAAVPCRLRPLGADHGRLVLDWPLPLEVGDRLVLRTTGSRSVLAGARVLDVDPPHLERRGDAARRGATLAGMSVHGDALHEVARRGAIRISQLRRMGIAGLDPVPGQVRVVDQWWIHEPALSSWRDRLLGAVQQQVERDPLTAGLSRGAAMPLLGPAAAQLLDLVICEAGLESRDGMITLAGRGQGLGAAETGVSEIERRLGRAPFAAPEAHDLAQLGLGARELAAAQQRGRLLRLEQGIVLLPPAPEMAMRILAALPQPFTTSQARQALGTTRRVAIPLLEHLDGRGWTRRLESGARITL